MISNAAQFFREYSPILCKGVQYRHQLPNEILSRQLYLGSEKHALSAAVIKGLGITHIVNASKTIRNAFEPGIKYMNAFVSDIESEFIDVYFMECYEFIHDALSQSDSRVLVHCAFGVSRSASLVIMYLMKYFNVSYNEAFKYTKRCREIIDPNDGFKK